MEEKDILNLGFAPSKKHMSSGMYNMGYRDYLLYLKDSERYLYIQFDTNRYIIQTICVRDNDVKLIENIKDIVDYIVDASIKLGVSNFKQQLNDLLT